MQALVRHRHLLPRRLAGAGLYALMVTAVTLPAATWLAGLLVGPAELRRQIVVTVGRFGAVHGGAGLYAVFLATFAALTILCLLLGPRRRYAFDWNLGPRLMDDGISAREKLAIVLRSGWGRAVLALAAFWLVIPLFA